MVGESSDGIETIEVQEATVSAVEGRTQAWLHGGMSTAMPAAATPPAGAADEAEHAPSFESSPRGSEASEPGELVASGVALPANDGPRAPEAANGHSRPQPGAGHAMRTAYATHHTAQRIPSLAVEPLALMDVQPDALVFAKVAGETCKRSFTLHNKHGEKTLVFKVKTRSPQRYLVRPVHGVLYAGESTAVTVGACLDEGDVQDRILVQFSTVPREFENTNVSEMWAVASAETTGKVMLDVHIAPTDEASAQPLRVVNADSFAVSLEEDTFSEEAELLLQNRDAQRAVLYKVKVRTPKHYEVSRSLGCIQAGQTMRIKVRHIAFSKMRVQLSQPRWEDKFLVQSVLLADDHDIDKATAVALWESVDRNLVVSQRLTCTVLRP